MIGIPATIRISLRALRVNKMRSALTMLGIIIGVGAVITMLAVGTGARERISAQMASIGSNLLIVMPGSSTSGGLRMGMGTQSTLTADDAEAIARECPSVLDVAPTYNGGAQVVYGNQNWSTGIVGSTPGILTVRDWSLSAGGPFTEQDVRGATKVCLLGQTVVDNLFGGMDPVGQIIRIKKVPFTVLGVLAKEGPVGLRPGPGRYDHRPPDDGPEEDLRFPGRGDGSADLGQGRQRRADGGGRGADHGTPDAAAPDRPPPGERFHGAQPHPDDGGPGAVGQGHGAPAGGDRLRLPARGRDRDHEHHARLGDGTDPGDRDPDVRGGEDPGTSGSSSSSRR